LIKLDNLSKAYGSKILLDNISYHIPEGSKIALVGNNGSGKTTLLRILLGEEEADSGSVLKPSRLSLGHLKQEASLDPNKTILEEALEGAKKLTVLKQELSVLSKELHTSSQDELIHRYSEVEAQYEKLGGYNLEAKAESLLMGLGFTKEKMCDSPANLSGGWAMRLEMAKMLINDPNFLVLDEPTNHLDLPSLVWFENYLKSYKGTLLFVSHDQELLEKLPDITLHLHKGIIRVYQGNYSSFLRQKEERELLEQSQVSNLEKKKNELEKFITRFGAKASKAKQAKSKEKQVEKLEKEIEDIESGQQADSRKMNLLLPPPPPSDRVLYTISNGAIGYREVLFEKINLLVEKGQKIGIVGANGIGKSTLLKTIACEIEALGGSFKASSRNVLAYFSQNLVDNLPPKGNLLDVVLNSAEISYKEARTLLGALLFTDEDLDKKIEVLSGGEKNRVALACVLAKKANFVLLDEPTNHLDIESVNALVEAFEKYTGTVLFVSHNRFFINSLSTHILALSKTKQVDVFEGKLDDYKRLCLVSGFPYVLEENSEKQKVESKKEETKTVSYEERKSHAKEINRLEKQLQKLDQEIETLSKKEKTLEEKLAKTAENGTHEEMSEVNKALWKTQEIKEKTEEEWMKTSEELDSLKS